MKNKFLSFMALSALVLPAFAQERAASGAMETQMTWSALSTAIQGVDGKVNGVGFRVDQVEVCGRKGLVYAPGSGGDGCITAATASNVITQLSNLSAQYYNLQSSQSVGHNCGAHGQVFNGANCVMPASSAPSVSCRLEVGGPLGNSNNYYCGGGYTTVRGYNSGNHTISCLRVVC